MNIEDLTLEELEDTINREIVNRRINTIEKETYKGDLKYIVKKVIEDIFNLQYEIGTDKNFQVFVEYNGELKISYKRKYAIYIEVKYKKGNTKRALYRDYTYYYVDKVKVCINMYGENVKIKDLVNKFEKDIIANEEKENKEIDTICKFLKENNLTIQDFDELCKLYQKNLYKVEEKLAHN